MSPKVRRILIIGAAIVAGVIVAAVVATIFGPDEEFVEDEPVAEVSEPTFYDDIIHMPAATGEMRTDLRDIHGNAIGVKCSTCHIDGDLGDPPARFVNELSDFHTDMEFAHGELSCTSCHAADNRDKLKLADGELIDYDDTIQLCAQCHSSTYKSYKHGAHGGAQGFWDTSKGPRERNDCVSCHYAHDPGYPPVVPAAPPRDRFLDRD